MAVIQLDALADIVFGGAVDFRQSPKIAAMAQAPDTDELVFLYEVDATRFGEGILRFTTSAGLDDVVRYGGFAYVPLDIQTDGWEWNGRGALPTPRLRMSNAGNALTGLAEAHDDLLGCKVTRIRTFKRFLDGEPEADDTAHFPKDVFFVERLVGQNKLLIEFELSAAMDQEGRRLPGRQILRDVCSHRYRVFRDGAFDYAKVSCPYAGDGTYSSSGEPSSATNDVCGKSLNDCKLRFGNQPLPFRGFPGVARVRA